MRSSLILILSILFFNSCGDQPIRLHTMDNDYENLDKFDKVINQYHDSLGKKYSIKEYPFDVECINKKEDLTRLIKEMLEFGGFQVQQVKDGHDVSKSEYYTIATINNRNFEFKTTSKGDYVDLETVYPVLQQVTKDFKPDFEYNFSNRNGGQIAYMIFAKSSDLVKAVDEGYPCSLESGKWNWDKQWKWGVYSDIKVDKIPSFEDLRKKYYETFQELYNRGFNVPNLTIQRIYIDDIFKKRIIDIIIDGGPMFTSSNDIIGNKIRCFWDGWGVVLAYTLITHYNGQPALYDKETEETIKLTAEEYLKKAETAIGKK